MTSREGLPKDGDDYRLQYRQLFVFFHWLLFLTGG
jgi:hypothetical protein